MMVRVALPAISVASQAKSRADIERSIELLVRCISALLLGLNLGVVRFSVDLRVEGRVLGMDELLIQSINRMTERQIARLWFIYTRNRAVSSDQDFVEAVVSSAEGELEGTIATDQIADADCWISFTGAPVLRCGKVRVQSPGRNTVGLENAEKPESVARWFPRYEASAKHRNEEYATANGPASPMDLSASDASSVLLTSIAESDRLRYGKHRGQYYAFRLTQIENGQPVFHGYAISENEVPPALCAALGE